MKFLNGNDRYLWSAVVCLWNARTTLNILQETTKEGKRRKTMLQGLGGTLRSQATSLVTAAKSFQGFDNMAAKDEYIHTEGLNVKTKKSKCKQPNGELPSSTTAAMSFMHPFQQPQSHQTPPLTASSHHSSSRRESVSASVSSSQHSNSQHLLSVVQSTLSAPASGNVSLSEMSNTTEAKKQQQQHSFSFHDNDDDDDDWEDDPILARIKQQHQGTTATETAALLLKDKNRFMNDLDDRLSKEIVQVQQQQHDEEAAIATAEAPPPPQRLLAGLWNGLKNTSANANATPKPTTATAPLSRPKKKRQQQQNEVEESFEIQTSAAVFDSHDMAEWNALQNQNSKLQKVYQFVVKDHPRECILVFSMILMLWVYFHGGAWSAGEV